MNKIMILGAGRMGGALIKGWIQKNKIEAKQICVIEKRKEVRTNIKKKLGVSIQENIPYNWFGDILIIAVKPQSLEIVFQEINKSKIKINTIISLVAGCTVSSIKKNINMKSVIVRSMPNITASVSKSITVLYSSSIIDIKIKRDIESTMTSVGHVKWIDSENMMDCITAISGSGPAYFFLFFESFVTAAIKSGLPKELSLELVTKTIEGSFEMILKGQNANKLIEQVASPGGTTEAALKVLDNSKKGLRRLMINTVDAAAKKSRQLEI